MRTLTYREVLELPADGPLKAVLSPRSGEYCHEYVDTGDSGAVLTYYLKGRPGYMRVIIMESTPSAALKLANEILVEPPSQPVTQPIHDKGGTRAKPYKVHHYQGTGPDRQIPSVQRRFARDSGELNRVLDTHYKVTAEHAAYRREVNAKRVPGLGWKLHG